VRRTLVALGLAALALANGGCLGKIRDSTTPRTAQEMFLLSTAAERAIAHVDSSRFAGKKVFVDVSRLGTIDQPYVESAFANFVAEGKGTLAPKDKAEIVVEVRSGSLALYDGSWGIGVPTFYGAGLAPPEDKTKFPTLISFTYDLHRSWAHFQVWAYDAHTNEFLGSWKDCWGSAYVGFFDDVYPKTGVGETLQGYTK
jgi:hypothetical protein